MDQHTAVVGVLRTTGLRAPQFAEFMQLKGWTTKLIWGDNKLILSALKNGPMRNEIEAPGGLKLMYIDPRFDVGVGPRHGNLAYRRRHWQGCS